MVLASFYSVWMYRLRYRYYSTWRPLSIRADRGVVLATVTQESRWLVATLWMYVAATLKADRGVVLAARTEYGHALYCAAATLQADRNSMLTAVTQRDQRCPAGTEDGAHRSTDHFSSSSSVVPVRSPWVRHRLEIAANVHSTQLSGSSGS